MRNKTNNSNKVYYIMAAIVGVALVVVIVVMIVIILARQKTDDETPKVEHYDEECFREVNGQRINMCKLDKPIIYLYPEQTSEVTVQLGHPEKLTTVYPKYNDGWKVLAQPNGDLIDLATGRSQYALYWEGSDYPARLHETGFVVKGTDTAEFLEEKLAILGLSEREANEFIIYWLPKMQHNPYNYIYFATAEEINDYMPIGVRPQPDTIIRVMMEFKPLQSSINIPEQTLPASERRGEGFTVVEWGGSEVKD